MRSHTWSHIWWPVDQSRNLCLPKSLTSWHQIKLWEGLALCKVHSPRLNAFFSGDVYSCKCPRLCLGEWIRNIPEILSVTVTSSWTACWWSTWTTTQVWCLLTVPVQAAWWGSLPGAHMSSPGDTWWHFLAQASVKPRVVWKPWYNVHNPPEMSAATGNVYLWLNCDSLFAWTIQRSIIMLCIF